MPIQDSQFIPVATTRDTTSSEAAPISSTDNAAHVTNKETASLLTYTTDITTALTSNSAAIPEGAEYLTVINESVTTLQSVRFIFGTSGVTATTDKGWRVSPGITTASGDLGPKILTVRIPRDATHWAWISESGTPTINVIFE